MIKIDVADQIRTSSSTKPKDPVLKKSLVLYKIYSLSTRELILFFYYFLVTMFHQNLLYNFYIGFSSELATRTCKVEMTKLLLVVLVQFSTVFVGDQIHKLNSVSEPAAMQSRRRTRAGVEEECGPRGGRALAEARGPAEQPAAPSRRGRGDPAARPAMAVRHGHGGGRGVPGARGCRACGVADLRSATRLDGEHEHGRAWGTSMGGGTAAPPPLGGLLRPSS